MADVTFKLNGKEITVPEGTTILEAALAVGVDIPTLCYHPALPPDGSCRLCLVEIEKWPTLQASCTTKVTEGMNVSTDTPQVVEARRAILQLLLAEHRVAPDACHKSSGCELAALAEKYGVTETPFPPIRPHYAIEDLNPFIQVDRNACVHCWRCVRACTWLNGVETIGVFQRSGDVHMGFGLDSTMEDSPCEFCGACVSVCPTGALQPKYLLEHDTGGERTTTRTTCIYCGVGCQIDFHVVDNKIVEATADWDTLPNRGLLCVKGRFGFDFLAHPDRLTTPLIRRNGNLEPATWDEALGLIGERLSTIKEESGPDAIGVLTSAKCTNEENYLLQKFGRQVIGTNNVDHCARL